jgi:hypothetical protein
MNAGMIFAHPGHELLVVGLMQRYRPHILFLTRADSAGDDEREALAIQGLEKLGLSERATFLHVREHDLYRWLFERDANAIMDLRRQVLDWLERVRPTRIFGDAFEVSNVTHDLGRAVLDSAWRDYCDRGYCDIASCENFELPLMYRSDPELWNLRFQEFPAGPFMSIELTPDELASKQAAADWIGSRRVEADMARQYFKLDKEIYRTVPCDRDYTVPPHGLRVHYEDWGRMQVQRGKYAPPILFMDHFAPLVRMLPRLT